MRCSVTAFALLCVLAATHAGAAEWTPISDDSGIRLELDTSSIVRQGDAALAWDRTTYAPGRVGVTSGDVEYRSARTLMRYDCARRTVVPMVRAFAFSSGAEVLRQNVEGSELPQPIVPDTPRERMLAMVCKVRPAPEPRPQIQTAVLPAKAAGAPAAGPAPEAAKKPVKRRKPAKPPKAEPHKQGADAAHSGEGEETPAAKDAKAEAKTSSGAKPKADAGKDGGKDAAHGDGKDAHAKEGKAAAEDAHGKSGGKKARDKDDGKGKGKDKGKPHEEAGAKDGQDAEAKSGHKDAHWSYTGKDGAANWHRLSKDYATCATGKRQSPIDIRDWVRVELAGLKFSYRPSPLRIVNNGHTIQVKYAPGSTITVGEKTYELKQFHFHHPAEERVNGRAFDMVAHLVHQSKEGDLAVVAVLLMAGDENPFLKTLWNHLPLDVGLEESLSSVQINVDDLLPKFQGYYTFMGSLTTPPCTEGVRWIVMRTPVQMSRTQIKVFGRLYEMNARPVQSTNGRLIKEVM